VKARRQPSRVFLEPVRTRWLLHSSPNYWQSVREICDRYGVILGLGDDASARSPTWYLFGGQKFDYVPDIITCAKASLRYAPLGR